MGVPGSAWQRLDRRVRAFFVAHLAATSFATLAVGVGYAFLRLPTMGFDLSLMIVAVVVMALGLPLAARFGARAVIYSALLGNLVFAAGAVVLPPFLAPLVVLLVLLPLLVALPYLERRESAVTTATIIASCAVLAAVAEWRRGSGLDLPTWLESGALLVFIPIAVSGIAYALRQNFDSLHRQTRALRDSQRLMAELADATRRGLERDLHDGAQQRLVGVSVHVGRASELLAEGRLEEAAAVMGDVGDQVRAAIGELRELARGIYPPLLAERGLESALMAAARRSVVPCTLDCESMPRHSPQVEAAVYFCVLEALTNAAKHSGATSVHVTLTATPVLAFTVTDNGSGFDADGDAVAEARGGLLGMRTRLGAVGGSLQVRSSPQGTVVRGWFPERGPD